MENKSFNEYNTLAGKLNNFSIFGMAGKGLGAAWKGVKSAGKYMLKGKDIEKDAIPHRGGIVGDVKKRYVAGEEYTRPVEYTSSKGSNGETLYNYVNPKNSTLESTADITQIPKKTMVNEHLKYGQIGKDAVKGGAATATVGAGAYFGIPAVKWAYNKVTGGAKQANDFKNEILHNKPATNPKVTNAARGTELAGATILGAATGGIPGAVLAPLAGYLGNSYGATGKFVGATAGLVGGAVVNKYLKKLKDRQKNLKLLESQNKNIVEETE